MSRQPSTVALSLLPAVLVLGFLVSRAPTQAKEAPAFGHLVQCPKPSEIRDGDLLTDAVHAAKRLVPQAYNANTPGNEWARHPWILEALLLVPRKPELPGVVALRRIGFRRCGPVTVARSWAVVVEFPGRKVAGDPPSAVFLANTTRGWRLWLATST